MKLYKVCIHLLVPDRINHNPTRFQLMLSSFFTVNTFLSCLTYVSGNTPYTDLLLLLRALCMYKMLEGMLEVNVRCFCYLIELPQELKSMKLQREYFIRHNTLCSLYLIRKNFCGFAQKKISDLCAKFSTYFALKITVKANILLFSKKGTF